MGRLLSVPFNIYIDLEVQHVLIKEITTIYFNGSKFIRYEICWNRNIVTMWIHLRSLYAPLLCLNFSPIKRIKIKYQTCGFIQENHVK